MRLAALAILLSLGPSGVAFVRVPHAVLGGALAALVITFANLARAAEMQVGEVSIPVPADAARVDCSPPREQLDDAVWTDVCFTSRDVSADEIVLEIRESLLSKGWFAGMWPPAMWIERPNPNGGCDVISARPFEPEGGDLKAVVVSFTSGSECVLSATETPK